MMAILGGLGSSSGRGGCVLFGGGDGDEMLVYGNVVVVTLYCNHSVSFDH